MTRTRILFTIASLFLAALTSCAPVSSIDAQGNVTLREPNAVLKWQGRTEFAAVKREKKISRDPRYTRAVERVSKRLCKAMGLPLNEWEFVVFEDKTPNAFALPGGKVGVNTGLFQIADTDALLAAVIGHEISHVITAHASQRMWHALATLIAAGAVADAADHRDRDHPELLAIGVVGVLFIIDSLPLSRFQEYESDKIGAVIMARAGYDPRQSITLWKRMRHIHQVHHQKTGKWQKPAWLRTHPPDNDRINALEAFMPVALKFYQKGE